MMSLASLVVSKVVGMIEPVVALLG
jgi:hypothetical protein